MTTNTTSTASQAPAVSIESNEFLLRLIEFAHAFAEENGNYGRIKAELIAHIDAHTAAAVAKARAEGFEEMRQAMAESAKIMAGACRRATAAEAKLEAIRQSVEGLRWCYKSGEPRGEREAVWRDEALALFTTPPKADESGLPG